jgi:hypothetical protein
MRPGGGRILDVTCPAMDALGSLHRKRPDSKWAGLLNKKLGVVQIDKEVRKDQRLSGYFQ